MRRMDVDGEQPTSSLRLDTLDHPMAETHRRLGLVADALGLTRPSYQAVRLAIHDLRAGRRGTGAGEILLAVAFRARPIEALMDILLD